MKRPNVEPPGRSRRNLWITAILGATTTFGAPVVVAALLVASFRHVATVPPEHKAAVLSDAIQGSMVAGGAWFVGGCAVLVGWLVVSRRARG
ncbi:MAG: hypothetical protein ABMA64_20370 [Myxococcota bacterium]